MKYLLALLLFLTTVTAFAQHPFADATLSQPVAVAATWYPTNISGCVRWHDASLLALSDNDSVSSWPDLSVSDIDLNSDYAPRRPTFQTDGSFTKAVYFDGTDVLTNANVADSSKTIFIVAYRTGTANATLFCFSSVTDQIYNSASGVWKYYEPNSSLTAGSAQSPGVVIIRYNSNTSADLRSQSGAWLNIDPANSYYSAGVTTIGADTGITTPIAAYVSEIIVYDSALSDADVNIVGAKLADKWAFSWTNL